MEVDRLTFSQLVISTFLSRGASLTVASIRTLGSYGGEMSVDMGTQNESSRCRSGRRSFGADIRFVRWTSVTGSVSQDRQRRDMCGYA